MKKVVLLIIGFFGILGCNKHDEEIVVSQHNYQEIARMIVSSEISDQELEAKKFSPDDIVSLIYAVAELNGLDFDNIQDILTKSQNFKSLSTTTNCTQNVELFEGNQGMVYSFGYYKDLGCDNDSSDEDWTLQFNNYGVSVNPDYVKWWGSWYLRQVFSVVYGGNLLACDLCSYPSKICIGTNGVALAGGVDYVKNNLYLWHQ